MKTYTRHSAKATYRSIGNAGVMELVFTGMLCEVAFAELSAKLLPLMREAAAVVVRYDLALVVIEGVLQPDFSHRSPDEPNVAVIVDHDHYDATVKFCSMLAERGFIRAVFLNSTEQIAMAYRWAERHAQLKRQGLTV